MEQDGAVAEHLIVAVDPGTEPMSYHLTRALSCLMLGLGLPWPGAGTAAESSTPVPAGSPVIELERLVFQPLPWLTEQSLMPAGEYHQVVVPDTLDLAQVACDAERC